MKVTKREVKCHTTSVCELLSPVSVLNSELNSATVAHYTLGDTLVGTAEQKRVNVHTPSVGSCNQQSPCQAQNSEKSLLHNDNKTLVDTAEQLRVGYGHQLERSNVHTPSVREV